MEQYKLRYHATFNRLYSHSSNMKYFEVKLEELPAEVVMASWLYMAAYEKYNKVFSQRQVMRENHYMLHAAYMSNNDDPMLAKAKWVQALKAYNKHCKCCRRLFKKQKQLFDAYEKVAIKHQHKILNLPLYTKWEDVKWDL